MQSSPIDRDRSRALWLAAQSFEALCGLGARFLAGEITHFPGWGAAFLDTESDAIREELLLLAGAGWLTTCSQPGRAEPERELHQRAFVSGFTTDELATRLAVLDGSGTVRIRVTRRADRALEPVPVTVERGLARVLIGGPAFDAELACFEDDLAPAQLEVLAQRPYVCAWDATWGPSDRLWSSLRAHLALPR